MYNAFRFFIIVIIIISATWLAVQRFIAVTCDMDEYFYGSTHPPTRAINRNPSGGGRTRLPLYNIMATIRTYQFCTNRIYRIFPKRNKDGRHRRERIARELARTCVRLIALAARNSVTTTMTSCGPGSRRTAVVQCAPDALRSRMFGVSASFPLVFSNGQT